jgi:hypothetical protein
LLTGFSDRVEVEWKWLLLPDPGDFRLPKASPNAIPMPTTRKAKALINARKRPERERPQAEDEFVEGFTWAEYHTCTEDECRNNEQVKIDLAKEQQLWHYLGRTSTETKAQYTHDPARPEHNTKSNFLDSIPKPVVQRPPPAPPRRSTSTIKPPSVPGVAGIKTDKPYIYKPRKHGDMYDPRGSPGASQWTAHTFAPRPGQNLPYGSDPRFKPSSPYSATQFPAPAGSSAPQLSHGYTGQIPGRPFQFPPASNTPRPQSQTAGNMLPPKTVKAASTKQSTTPIPVPVVPGAKASADVIRKYSAFFSVNHNR